MKLRYLVFLLAVTTCSGVAVGAVAHGVVWPWSLDAQFWREFWAGPPTAGIFAVIAALIAFVPARRRAR